MENKITYLKVTDKNQVAEIVEKVKELKADDVFAIILVNAKLDDIEKNQLENTKMPILMLKDGQNADGLEKITEIIDESLAGGIMNVSIDDIKNTLKDATYIGTSLFETSIKTMENDIKNQIFNSISTKNIEKASKIWTILTVSAEAEFEYIQNLVDNICGYFDEDVNKILSTNFSEGSTGKAQVLIISN